MYGWFFIKKIIGRIAWFLHNNICPQCKLVYNIQNDNYWLPLH